MKSQQVYFNIGGSEDIVLSFNQPKTGENDGRQWFMYGVEHDGEKKIIFAQPELHDKLKHYQKGDKLTIEQIDKYVWNVIPFGDVKRDRGVAAGAKGIPANKEVVQPAKAENWDLINAKKSYNIHKQVCLKLAVGLEKDKVDYKRVAKNMDRLLAVLNNDYARANSHLASASNLFNLEAIWAKYSEVWADTLTDNEFKLLEGDYQTVEEKLKDESNLPF